MACSNPESTYPQEHFSDAHHKIAGADAGGGGGGSTKYTNNDEQATAIEAKHISFASSTACEASTQTLSIVRQVTEGPSRPDSGGALPKPATNVEGNGWSQQRLSTANKRDSGLSVEGSSNIHSPGRCPSPGSRQFKRGPPSLAGGASIGGASATPSTLTPEEELISRKVRSLYNDSGSDMQSSYSRRGGGGDSDAGGGRKRHSRGLRSSLVVTDEEGGTEEAYTDTGIVPVGKEQRDTARTGGREARQSTDEAQKPSLEVTEHERDDMLWAGGIEDWENVDGKDIDRYGFISPDGKPGQQRRVSTSLFLQSTAPKKKHRNHHLRLLVNPFENGPANEMLQSPLKQEKEEFKEKEVERAKKWRAMAVSMTTNKTSRWRRKSAENSTEEGSGANWRFITTDSKLISRTWKGIPDCWRSAAWHSFLTASAEKRGDCLADEELKAIYQELVDRGCADDVQIDLDVPRTINSHIMFRRRYRGGQRLLFRVLHCLALYFSSIGYVQGMASIAATLLCYYDEETTFIMLVRLWELRGLARLYQPGFGGLMEALDEFEQKWLDSGALGRKLETLGIGSMAYGTKWYLTLFNYSIPFQAQLRVWDVFMLLGDPDSPASASAKASRKGIEKQDHGFPGIHFSGLKNSTASTRSRRAGIGFSFPRPKTSNNVSGNMNTIAVEPTAATTNAISSPIPYHRSPSTVPYEESFHGTLDVLHATSAALIDGMKDILLKSDFENGMKVLTSWIPIKDEELLMRVVKNEWKAKKKRKLFKVGGSGNRNSGGYKSGGE